MTRGSTFSGSFVASANASTSFGRDEDHEFALLRDLRRAAEQRAEERDVHQDRHAGVDLALVGADEAADDRGLAVLDHDARVGFRRVDDDAALDRRLGRQVRDLGLACPS